ncbi:MAG: iron chaperone [Solirubrobacterales bacterium]
MDTSKPALKSIDEYIAQFSPEIQKLLHELRKVIRESAPEAVEKISYQMPAFEYHGILVYFAAFKYHIGFFPTASGINAFQDRLVGYKTTKGTVHFPYGKPIPYDLVREIVRFRVDENRLKAEKKRQSRNRRCEGTQTPGQG